MTSAKAKKGVPVTSQEGTAKNTHASHPNSHNQLTEGDVPESKRDAHSQKIELKHPERVSQQQSAQEKSPSEKPSPQKSPQRSTIKEDIPASPAKKDGMATSVKPIDLYEDEVEQYLKLYLGQLDQSMRNSFLSEPKALLERANMGQDPVWFELLEGKELEKKVGLAVAHVDNTVFTTRRMVILHFTSEDRERYQEFLGKFVEHLWKNDECNEIKISLYYLEDQNSNLGADKHLQECIKKLGFRWKQLTNDKYTGKRYIDYLIKRPENINSQVVNA